MLPAFASNISLCSQSFFWILKTEAERKLSLEKSSLLLWTVRHLVFDRLGLQSRHQPYFVEIFVFGHYSSWKRQPGVNRYQTKNSKTPDNPCWCAIFYSDDLYVILLNSLICSSRHRTTILSSLATRLKTFRWLIAFFIILKVSSIIVFVVLHIRWLQQT